MHSEATDATRRTLLRGILVAGCTVTLPTLIGGCDQKGAPSGGTTPAGSGSAETASQKPLPDASSPPARATAERTGKLSKAQVKYQEQPKGDQHCANCLQFVAESSTCMVVEGPISPQGWCTVWVKGA